MDGISSLEISEFTHRHLEMSHLVARPVVPQGEDNPAACMWFAYNANTIEKQNTIFDLEKFLKARFEGII